MTIDEAIKEISEAVESHKQLKLDLSGRHIAEVLVLKSAKIGADRLAEALEVAVEELKKDKPENILTDAEKDYLAMVIKPFKDRIKNITKIREMPAGLEYISLRVESVDKGYEDLLFPFFEEGTMYKGMEAGKAYSLKEIGLE